MNAIFDEAKGVYRVNNPDGTFATYTPAQYRELSAVTTNKSVDDTKTVEDEDANDSSKKDDEQKNESSVEDDGVVEDNVIHGLYKTLQPIPYTDEEGNVLDETEVGSVQEVPVELGDSWVEQGLAEKFIEEDNTQA